MATDYFSSTPTTGMRRACGEVDANDDCASLATAGVENSRFAPRLQHPNPAPNFPPKKKESSRYSRGSDERSDSSSIRSSSSACGSTNNSPCPSPSPTESMNDKEVSSCSALTNSTPRYYIIKSNSQNMIEASLNRGVWAFTPSTERKLQKAFKEGKNLYLIFSVQGSSHFQGYARLTSLVVLGKISEFSAPNLGQTYKIEWLKRANIPFQSTRHLQNPWNENRKVQISRDGQEVEPSVGEALCKLWDKVPVFVPKSLFLTQMKTGDSQNEIARHENDIHDSNCHVTRTQRFPGRPIRGFQHSVNSQSSSTPSSSSSSSSYSTSNFFSKNCHCSK